MLIIAVVVMFDVRFIHPLNDMEENDVRGSLGPQTSNVLPATRH